MLIEKTIKTNKPKKDKYNLTIGTFDALHLGHKKILNELVKESNNDKVKTCIITFQNRPKHIIKNKNDGIILDNEERLKYFQKLGIDLVLFLKFDQKFANINAENFLEILYQYLRINKIIVGEDFKFGYKNKGTLNTLKKYGHLYNIKIKIIKNVKKFAVKIGTTLIKQDIINGKVDQAYSLLGRFFSIKGIVIRGNGLGNQIGYPTINLKLINNTILPGFGVYLTQISYLNKYYFGMTYIGNNFVNNKNVIETNIFNFNKNVYQKKISIFFIKKLRNDLKFSRLEGLKLQLHKDKQKAMALLKKYKNIHL